jgi:hypothetical protein
MPMKSTLTAFVVLGCFRATMLSQAHLDGTAVSKRITPTVVFIRGHAANGGDVHGSGFIISSDGKIATCLHVIDGLVRGGVRLSTGEVFDDFTVRAFDKRKDLAIIQIAATDLPTAEMANSDEVQPGESVYLFGNPLEFQGTVTAGVVSAVRLMPEGFKVIQTDAATNPGNSGGPLVNSQGKVIGVLSFKRKQAENLNFAISVNYIRGMMGTSQTSISLTELGTRLANAVDVFQSNSLPGVWKSLVNGRSMNLRWDGDTVYVEPILSEAERQEGVYTVSELHKQGTEYVGYRRLRFSCQYRAGNELRTKVCNKEFPIKLNSVKPNRIEGVTVAPPDDALFDCEYCAYAPLGGEWKPFSWIPVE